SLRVLSVVRGVRPQLIGSRDGDELAFLDVVTLVDQETAELPGYLRADNHVVGRDDAGQHQRRRRVIQVGIDTPGEGADQNKNKRKAQAFRGHSNNCMKQMFECQGRTNTRGGGSCEGLQAPRQSVSSWR